MEGKKFILFWLNMFCDCIISWMAHKYYYRVLLPWYVLVAYIKLFLHYFEKNVPMAHDYQYHFYNEARRKKPRYIVIFIY